MGKEDLKFVPVECADSSLIGHMADCDGCKRRVKCLIERQEFLLLDMLRINNLIIKEVGK